MNEAFDAVSVAVEKTSIGFDKLYTYLVPDEMKDDAAEGCRVKVSFGHGLRQGVIIEKTTVEDTKGLKRISELIDREPVLSKEMLGLAGFMHDRCYCTWFDCCAAMLPAGLSVRLTYTYSAVRDFDISVLSSECQAVMNLLMTSRNEVREDILLKKAGLADDKLLRELVRLGAVKRTEIIKKRISDVTVKMIRLKGEIPEGKLTPQQEDILRVLQDVGEASVKEICYFTGVSSSVPATLVKNGICEFFDASPPPAVSEDIAVDDSDIILTEKQQAAFDLLLDKYQSGEPSVTLLYGVTGSGKTSVFMKLIDRVSEEGRGVICMVPEISLTPQLLAKFNARYGNKVAVFHSALSLGKRLSEWKRVKNGEATIAVGTRSAIFAPMQDIGLIVMDEEQEYSYKSSSTPRFHARELAKYRCCANKCPLVLSSATPAVESYHYAREGRYSLCTLDSRYAGASLPDVIIADMNEEQSRGNMSGYSEVLLRAIGENLANKQQSIILLNRRGHNTFIACCKCREVMSCPNCSISLTYHSANHRLMCHYCGYSIPVPSSCPSCGSDKIRYSGAGTQRAEQELQSFFPSARILRLDTDSTMQRYSYEKKLNAFRSGEYDIMLGTQMVAKGLDFPDVTLAAVLSADSMLHGNDFRSYERTFSMLTQVAGRSGRGVLAGRAIIQTFEPESIIIELASQQNYDEFFKMEIALRKAMLYPPFADIGVVVFTGLDRQLVSEAAKYFSDELVRLAESEYKKLPMRVMGPSPATVMKLNGKYRFRLIIKFKNSPEFREMMTRLLRELCNNRKYSEVTAYMDVDPDNII